MSYEWVMWVVLAMIFFLLEIVKPKWVVFWFALGAVAAAVSSVVLPRTSYIQNLPFNIFYVDIIIFFAVSIILVIVARPIMTWIFKVEDKPMHVQAAIGREELCIEDIDNMRKQGAIKLYGTPWNARSSLNGVIIKAGCKVRIVDIEGLSLIVEPVANGDELKDLGKKERSAK